VHDRCVARFLPVVENVNRVPVPHEPRQELLLGHKEMVAAVGAEDVADEKHLHRNLTPDCNEQAGV
jgi:hypothetical protein